MAARTKLTLTLLLIAAINAGCGLLGLDTRLDRRAEIEATINALALAGETKDEETFKQHLAATIVMEVLSGGEGATEESRAELIERLQEIWADVETNRITAQLTDLSVDGTTAVGEGTFSLEFTDSAGNRAQCAGVGRAEFRFTNGRWVVAGVTIIESECDVTDPAPGDPEDPPTDPGDDPGSDPGTGPGTDPGTDPSAPSFSFESCEYLVLGAQGPLVEAVQASLTYLGYNTYGVDGDYGSYTVRAVRAFQTDAGLYVDGETGPKTLAALHEALQARGGAFVCDEYESAPNAGITTVSYAALRAGTPYEAEVIIYESPVPGPTLVFVGCIHGNEKSGHLAMLEAIDRGITISKGRLVLVPAFNRIACEQNRRTLSRSGSALSGTDFNRMFDVGKTPNYLIAQEMWKLITSQPNLAFVVDFHDGFVNSLANTLLHTRQSKAGQIADRLKVALNQMRPSGSRGPSWDAYPEPISGSLIRKVGRDLGVPGILIELAGRSPGDPLSLRKEYVWRIIRQIGDEFGMTIAF